MGDRVRFEGFSELAKTLKAMPEWIAEKELNLTVRAAAAVMQKEARRLAPKDTGLLSKNILIRKVKAIKGPYDRYVGRYILGVRSRLVSRRKRRKMTKEERAIQRLREPYYWHFIEFGTSRAAAVPYLRGAFEATKVEAVGTMRERLKKALSYENLRKLRRQAARDGQKRGRR